MTDVTIHRLEDLVKSGNLIEAEEYLEQIQPKNQQEEIKLKLIHAELYLRKNNYQDAHETVTAIPTGTHGSMSVQDLFQLYAIQARTEIYLHKVADYPQTKQHLEEILENIQASGEMVGEDTEVKTLFATNLLVEGDYLLMEAKYDEAIAAYRQGIELLTTIEDGKDLVVLYNMISNAYFRKGELDLAQQYYSKCVSLAKSIGNYRYVIGGSMNMGLVSWQQGKLEEALEYFLQANDWSKQYDDTILLGLSLLNIGLIKIELGELDKALDVLETSYGIMIKQERYDRVISILNNIGIVYDIQGKLELSLQKYMESLALSEKLQDKFHSAQIHHNIGIIYRKKTEFTKAEDHLLKSFDKFEEIGNNLELIKVLYNLVLTYHGLDDKKQMQTSLQKMEELSKEENSISSILYALAKAEYLKSSNRIMDRVEAQKILYGISQKDGVSYHQIVQAKLSLADLLIFEIETTKADEVFNEVTSIFNELLELAISKKHEALKIDILILKARLHFVQGNISNSYNIINQALTEAKEKELDYIIRKAFDEKETFNSNLEEWEELVNEGATILDLLKESKIESYIKKVLNEHRDLISAKGQ